MLMGVHSVSRVFFFLYTLGEQVEFLSKRRHVYLHPSGCLNVSAINGLNLDYIVESIHLALTTSPWPCGFWSGSEISVKGAFQPDWNSHLDWTFHVFCRPSYCKLLLNCQWLLTEVQSLVIVTVSRLWWSFRWEGMNMGWDHAWCVRYTVGQP